MQFELLAIGRAVPRLRMAQSETAAVAQELQCRSAHDCRTVSRLYERAGIDYRHSVLLDESESAAVGQSFYPAQEEKREEKECGSFPMLAARMERYGSEAPLLAAAAAGEALARAGVAAGDISRLIVVSCTGFGSPGVSHRLIEMLDLPPTIERTEIGFMGCHGAINGLRTARDAALAEPGSNVLMCAVELCSLHFRREFTPEQIVSNAIFADGAAAVVGRAGAANGSAADGGGCAGTGWSLSATGSFIVPGTAGQMGWYIGDDAFRMVLSPQLPETIRRHLPGWLNAWLASHGLRVEDIAHWAVHPGGIRILNAVRDALHLAPQAVQASYEVFRRYGNMSSPTVLFILEQLIGEGAKRPCVAIAFGPGVTIEALLFS